MGIDLKTLTGALVLAFALAACETPQDKAVNNMVGASLGQCDTERDPDAYAGKLREILKTVQINDLETLQTSKMLVCLDSRMSKTIFSGVLHDRKTGGIVALRDGSEAPQTLETFAKTIRDGKVPSNGEWMFATQSLNEGTSAIEWKRGSILDQDMINKNAHLKLPPVRRFQ